MPASDVIVDPLAHQPSPSAELVSANDGADTAAAPVAAASPSTGTEPAGGSTDAQKDVVTTDGTGVAANAATVPETYDLKLPEASTLDPALLERTAAIARARGLSNDQAQAMVDLVAQEAQAREAALLEAHQPGGAKWQETVAKWTAETEADPSLGKTPEERKAAIQRGTRILAKYGEANPAEKEAMTAFLNDSGLGSHPAAVKFFAWLGKAAGEGQIIPGGERQAPRSAEEKFYGKTTPLT